MRVVPFPNADEQGPEAGWLAELEAAATTALQLFLGDPRQVVATDEVADDEHLGMPWHR